MRQLDFFDQAAVSDAGGDPARLAVGPSLVPPAGPPAPDVTPEPAPATSIPPPGAPAPAALASSQHGALLAQWLAARLGRRVRLTFTANRSTMLSYRERGGVLRIRVHEMFRRASAREWTAVADYVDGKSRSAGRILDDFVLASAPARPPADPSLHRTAGRFHDLRPILDALNETYFHGAVRAAITWGGSSSRRTRRTIQLGLYVREERLIRIHPCLDPAFVPRWYVAWIVFHEMLHDVFGIERDRGRRSVHPPEFSAIEQSYPDYPRCRAWERDNIHRLLKYRAPR